MIDSTGHPEFTGLPLAITTDRGRARQAALQAAARVDMTPTSLVPFESQGSLLIIGPETPAGQVADRLKDRLLCLVLALPDDAGGRPARTVDDSGDYMVVHGHLGSLQGHLGQYKAVLETPDGEVNLAGLKGDQREHFDLVLDLQREPAIPLEMKPFGYYAPGDDPGALETAVAALPEMVGEFEKPKYFEYDPDICAHGNSGQKGCTRCLDACPAGAITSIGDLIEVDPYRCQGGGTCTAVCPTSAIRYRYPNAGDQLERLRTLLKTYRAEGGAQACVLFHDGESGRHLLEQVAQRLPEHVLPVQVEEIGATGMDVWLAGLAYGAGQISLLATADTPPTMLAALQRELGYAGGILEGMGHDPDRIRLVTAASADDLVGLLEGSEPMPEAAPAATFAGVDEKRTTIWMAVDHLWASAPDRQQRAPLPQGAPFGEVVVDQEACTLCMSCVAVCPTQALMDGDEKPQLFFDESRCVQCGLCTNVCPESAITGLNPRFTYDAGLRREKRLLYEEEPFKCIGCGKPFATESVINRMTERLKAHHMFQSEDALRRLQMCEECRVQDLFQAERDKSGEPKTRMKVFDMKGRQ